ncbi:MAG TPA: NAD(+) diphosphatase [Marmoricola sp.]|nr:NAD(+) diphosphatase [Marmoricola sp.]
MQTEIALSRHAHDRIASRRVDEQWLAEIWADPATRVLVMAGARVPVVEGKVTWCSPAEAGDSGTRVLLGGRDGVVHVAVIRSADSATAEHRPIRDALAIVGDDGGFLVHAVGLAEWHWATRHCPRCGGSLSSTHQGHVLHCDGCGRDQFPRTDPAVIMLITVGDGEDERCLLGRRPEWPPGRWSTLAGFVEPGETLEHAVRREVLEEAGVTVGEVSYQGSQPWPLPASLMLGFYGRAISDDIAVDGVELESARWFTRAEIKAGGESGEVLFPPGISISRALIEDWYGEPLPGVW